MNFAAGDKCPLLQIEFYFCRKVDIQFYFMQEKRRER